MLCVRAAEQDRGEGGTEWMRRSVVVKMEEEVSLPFSPSSQMPAVALPCPPRSSASELSLQEGETDGQERPLCAPVEFGVKVKVTLATVTGRNCALSKFIY